MARHSESDTTAIFELADKWRIDCLVGEKSLLWSGEDIWTAANLKDFKKHFTDRPDQSQRTFLEKFEEQLEPASVNVTKLACELMFIYFLFPSTVSGETKRRTIYHIASWKNVNIEEEGAKLLAHLDKGIGGPGPAYNFRRPFEISYLANVALRLSSEAPDVREAVLTDHVRLRAILNEVEADAGATRHSRDILLHLLFPDKYERIASRPHKRLIAEVFEEIIEDTVPEDLDDKLLAIRKKLEQLLPGQKLDFYWSPLKECWYVSGEEDHLNPLQGLSIKRQVVFYGPPGTGKTFEAQALADRLIRQALLRALGPKNFFEDVTGVNQQVKTRIRRIQFHPGYSYEDLIRGLQLIEGGKTEYSDGVLLRVIDEIQKDPPEQKEVPFVLILDEMNRADLSKVLGECFSLLEDREAVVQLAGQDKEPREISVPPKLHIIGTMNLIDQSLEQIDFALRRRFLWYLRGFNREQFIQVSQHRWEKLRREKRLKKDWDKFAPEFDRLADHAEMINSEIDKHPSLGSQYQIGHTYFCDVVYFVEKDLAQQPGRRSILYSPKGNGRSETVGVLWKYSLKPLLEQYLSGVDTADRQLFLDTAEKILMSGSTE
jgi:5-methylcytosine-specific restriction protein B